MPEFDLVIIGGGPAGSAAAVYAARKQLKTLLITKEWGGQSIVSADIQNWIGTPSISGTELAKSFETHVNVHVGESLSIKDKTLVSGITKNDDRFTITTEAGEEILTHSILIASGSGRRKLSVPGASEFENKGVTYCASCDGPLFSGMDVAVIGGGNASFETAAQLLAYAKSVTLLHHGDNFKADPVTVEKVLSHPNITALKNAETTEIVGDKFVSGLKYKDIKTGEEKEFSVAGIFVEIGMIPNTGFIGDTVPLDEYKRVKIDPWTQKTETTNIWSAGDCTNIRYHQNNISAGDAVRAIEDIYITLRAK